jgi:hypothetical protein
MVMDGKREMIKEFEDEYWRAFYKFDLRSECIRREQALAAVPRLHYKVIVEDSDGKVVDVDLCPDLGLDSIGGMLLENGCFTPFKKTPNGYAINPYEIFHEAGEHGILGTPSKIVKRLELFYKRIAKRVCPTTFQSIVGAFSFGLSKPKTQHGTDVSKKLERGFQLKILVASRLDHDTCHIDQRAYCDKYVDKKVNALFYDYLMFELGVKPGKITTSVQEQNAVEQNTLMMALAKSATAGSFESAVNIAQMAFARENTVNISPWWTTSPFALKWLFEFHVKHAMSRGGFRQAKQ